MCVYTCICKMSLNDVAYCLVFIDAVVSFAAVVWMGIWSLCLSGQDGDTCEPSSWSVWLLQENRENTAARLLFAALGLILVVVRAFIVSYWRSPGMMWLAAAIYSVCSAFLLGAVMHGRLMHWWVALAGLIDCIFAVVVVLAELQG